MKHVLTALAALLLPTLLPAQSCPPDALRVFSWNIRDLGQSKDDAEIRVMAQELRTADIVAIQEVVAGNGGAQAVARLDDALDRTGARWDYKVSDPTTGDGVERYAFLWKTHRALLRNAELAPDLSVVLDREPYLGWFRVKGGHELLLVNFHAVPTKKKPAREIRLLPELAALVDCPGALHCLVLGDFNLDSQHAIYQGLRDLGFVDTIDGKTALKMRRNAGEHLTHPYDDIFVERDAPVCASAVHDFSVTYPTLKEARSISDHLPISVRLALSHE